MPEHTYYLTRRRFALTAAGAFSGTLLSAAETPGQWAGPAVVRKVYMGGRPSWPRPDVDMEQERATVEARLAEIERKYPNKVRFTGGEMVRNAQEMQAWLARGEDCDAILAFNMVTIVSSQLKAIIDSKKPAVMFAQPYQGHDWVHAAAYVQKGARFDFVASSNFSDLDPWIPLFGTIHHLRHSKVLLMSPPATHPRSESFTERFGTAFAYPTYAELKALYDGADRAKAEKMAAEFIATAARVVEPTQPEIVDSMRLHLAIGEMLKQQKANAIAIDCLGGFGRKELPAYPCVSFSKLNDVGLYGVCECDLDSTMTQLLVTSFSGIPGFVSDPVFDCSRNEVIHAHCVSATRLHGIHGASSPYWVRTHLEDHKGVSMQVLAPTGGPVTVAKFLGGGRMLLSTGEALGNVDDERGCRTKIRTRVPDAEKLLAGWAKPLNEGPGMAGTRDLLHRVVFYGDHVKGIGRLARLTGFQVNMEA